MIIGSDVEADVLIIQQGELDLHRLFAARPLLPGQGFMIDQLLSLSMDGKMALFIGNQLVSARKREPDRSTIRSGRDDEIEFHLLAPEIVGHVNAGIEIGIFNPLIMGHAGAPGVGIIADVIVGFRSQLIHPLAP